MGRIILISMFLLLNMEHIHWMCI